MATDSDTAPGGPTDHHFPDSRAKNDLMFSIADNLHNVSLRIQKATKSAGRRADTVQLLAVSKTQPAEQIMAAFRAGQRAFGENYAQEARDKQEALKALSSEQDLRTISWHFIGPLQSNKTRLVAEHFDWVHSVDRLKIARRLSDQRPAQLPPLQVCLQINIDAEPSKAGISPEELPALADAVAGLPGITLRGVMAIPAGGGSKEKTRDSFLRMRAAFEQLTQQHPGIDTLSMGMSADLELAIECGSTMVRVGTAIFGHRNQQASHQLIGRCDGKNTTRE